MRLDYSPSAARFTPALFVCGALPVLLCGGEFLQGKSFWTSVLCAALGFVFMLLCFTPFYLLKKKYNFDFSSSAAESGGKASLIVFAYYAAYFLIVAVSLTVRFVDMFTSSVNSEADPTVMGLLIFAACACGTSRGVSGTSRAAVFVFAFLIISLAAIFCGSAKYFDFSANSAYASLEFSDLTPKAVDCLTLAFVPVAFGFAFCTTKNLKLRRAVRLSCAVFGLTVLALVFVYFVCGSYGETRSYSFELLAQISDFGDMRGFDSLYTAAATGCLFIAVSVLLCCARRCAPIRLQSSGIITPVFAFIAFTVFCLAVYVAPIKRALTDSLFLAVLNIISALVIPCVYMFKLKNGRRQKETE